MTQTFTFAQFEHLVDSTDAQLAGIPHGNAIVLHDGRSRPMTVRDHFAGVFAAFERQGRQGTVRLDTDRCIDYWRDCVLALDPPAFRQLPARRLQEKGDHPVVIPTFCGPVLRPAACHFECLDGLGAPGLSDVRVQRVRAGFNRKAVLGKSHRFNPPPETFICYGSASATGRFIYGQRGHKSEAPVKDLRAYLVQVVGFTNERATEYAVLPERSMKLGA